MFFKGCPDSYWFNVYIETISNVLPGACTAIFDLILRGSELLKSNIFPSQKIFKGGTNGIPE